MRCPHCEEYDIPNQEIEYPTNIVKELKDKIFELETQVEDQKELIKSVPLYNVTGMELGRIITPLLVNICKEVHPEKDGLTIAMKILSTLREKTNKNGGEL